METPTHDQLFQLPSPFFSEAFDDMKANARSRLGTWTYILSCLYPLHYQPKLTLGSVYTLLPVAHKYNSTRLLTRLVAFVEGKS
ncbi:hypothetical protein FOA52_006823 [Chlamydomonas sp. UWO 241]|nr:hypothetical protein FOA52_006823 [Chlamydomonas sp. UWO 241]